ncbi:hypothetical protein LINPERPRIM_LOCUS1192 [Linum perenne]
MGQSCGCLCSPSQWPTWNFHEEHQD